MKSIYYNDQPIAPFPTDSIHPSERIFGDGLSREVGAYGLFGYDDYIDTTIYPYKAEVDIADLPETPEREKLIRTTPIIHIQSTSILQSELRILLAAQYPEDRYPDIHAIVSGGLLLTRRFNDTRLPLTLSTGSDRDFTSQIGYQGESVEENKIVDANNISRAKVTYLAQQRLSNRSIGGGEPSIGFDGLYGYTMAVYDPRYVAKLGSTSSGLSYFTENPKRALLTIVQAHHS